MSNRIVVVAGPTAVGKTKYAIDIAQSFNGEIVSCDSMQLYKYLNIGSAKPSYEELSMAKHHLVDEIDPSQDFSVALYCKLAREAIDDILNRGKLPIIAGGTGLYLNSILYDMDFSSSERNYEFRSMYEDLANKYGKIHVHNILRELDEKAASEIHPNNLVKVIRALEIIHSGKSKKSFEEKSFTKSKYEPFLICLNRDREELYNRINLRVDIMMKEGLLDEVKNLLKMNVPRNSTAMKAIGYKELIDYLYGNISLDDAVGLIKRNSRRYAKRQLTWFRRYDDMKWFNLSLQNEKDVLEWLAKKV